MFTEPAGRQIMGLVGSLVQESGEVTDKVRQGQKMPNDGRPMVEVIKELRLPRRT
jgi:NTP pyrophosphatase (non-canonical NTP hydrolase)